MALILPLRFIFIHFIKKNLKVKKLFFFDNGVVNQLQGFFEFEEIKRNNFLGRLFESFISKIFTKAVLTILKTHFIIFAIIKIMKLILSTKEAISSSPSKPPLPFLFPQKN